MLVQQKKYHGPVEATVDILSGRWKPLILWALREGTLRFGQIEEELAVVTPNITQRMLTKQLRELENDGLIARKVYPEVPPKVEYTLTEKYLSLMPIVESMYTWGKEHMADCIEPDRKSSITKSPSLKNSRR
jgi:DNA-binding HxlR family transcriptional regulator